LGGVALLTLYPSSFGEFFRAKGITEASEGEKKRAIDEHILFGGYPRVVLEESEVLKLAKILALQTANITNFTNILTTAHIEYKKIKKSERA